MRAPPPWCCLCVSLLPPSSRIPRTCTVLRANLFIANPIRYAYPDTQAEVSVTSTLPSTLISTLIPLFPPFLHPFSPWPLSNRSQGCQTSKTSANQKQSRSRFSCCHTSARPLHYRRSRARHGRGFVTGTSSSGRPSSPPTPSQSTASCSLDNLVNFSEGAEKISPSPTSRIMAAAPSLPPTEGGSYYKLFAGK
jgi:hypothetical protein